MLNKIYNENCLEGMKKIPDGAVDFILTDLPYGTTNCSFDVKIDLQKFWKEILRITKENAAVALFSQLPFSAELIMSNRKMFRYEWIWEKSLGVGYLNAKKMPLRCHENILIFYRKLPTYNPQWQKGKPIQRRHCSREMTKNYNGHYSTDWIQDGEHYYPRDVLYFNSTVGQESRFHPQQKPVDLLEYLIRTYTNEGEVVLDATIGSGSTAVAAINTGRKFVGFETDEKYFEIAQKRINEALQKKSEGLFNLTEEV